MKREIKFRGLKKDGQFAFGNLLSHAAIGKWGNQEYYSYADVDPNTVGQFTGLADKNGKEIYEGDIVTDNGVVVWNQDSASFLIDYGDVGLHEFDNEISNWCEVIGYIHTTPNLLTTK